MDQKVKPLITDKDFKLESEEFNSRAEKFKLIFNASPDMIFILSHNGLILDANESALAGYGYSNNQAFGMSFESLLSKASHIKKARKLFESAHRGAEIDYEWMTKTKTGKNIPVDIRLRSLKLNDNDEKSAVVLILRDISHKQKADEAISSLARATNLLEFEDFIRESVRSLAQLYNTKFAFVGRLQPDKKHVSTLAVWAGDRFADNFTYSLEGTPCKDVLDLKVELIPDKADELYPDDEMLIQMGIKSYFGHPMVAERKMKGLVSVMNDATLNVEEWAGPVLGLFANRLAVEIERFEATQELQASKENLEEQVRKRTQKIEEQTNIIKQNNIALEEANEEMKSFCYSVSHDLRAPLRGISGFSDIVLEDYEDKLDDIGKEYLHRIKDSTTNMSDLIDGMLQLSRVSHQDIEIEEFNLSLLAEEVIHGISSLERERKIKVEIEPDLKCKADRGLIIILLQNLLGNAWKYSAKKDISRISVFQKEVDGRPVFIIRDNGAGFDTRYADKLFEPFKRLHGESEFSGSGIGLATVKSVINKHNGKIWAESEIEQGSSFYFTLG